MKATSMIFIVGMCIHENTCCKIIYMQKAMAGILRSCMSIVIAYIQIMQNQNTGHKCVLLQV